MTQTFLQQLDQLATLAAREIYMYSHPTEEQKQTALAILLSQWLRTNEDNIAEATLNLAATALQNNSCYEEGQILRDLARLDSIERKVRWEIGPSHELLNRIGWTTRSRS